MNRAARREWDPEFRQRALALMDPENHIASMEEMDFANGHEAELRAANDALTTALSALLHRDGVTNRTYANLAERHVEALSWLRILRGDTPLGKEVTQAWWDETVEMTRAYPEEGRSFREAWNALQRRIEQQTKQWVEKKGLPPKAFSEPDEYGFLRVDAAIRRSENKQEYPGDTSGLAQGLQLDEIGGVADQLADLLEVSQEEGQRLCAILQGVVDGKRLAQEDCEPTWKRVLATLRRSPGHSFIGAWNAVQIGMVKLLMRSVTLAFTGVVLQHAADEQAAERILFERYQRGPLLDSVVLRGSDLGYALAEAAHQQQSRRKQLYERMEQIRASTAHDIEERLSEVDPEAARLLVRARESAYSSPNDTLADARRIGERLVQQLHFRFETRQNGNGAGDYRKFLKNLKRSRVLNGQKIRDFHRLYTLGNKGVHPNSMLDYERPDLQKDAIEALEIIGRLVPWFVGKWNPV